jgi:hypothetical protein
VIEMPVRDEDVFDVGGIESCLPHAVQDGIAGIWVRCIDQHESGARRHQV